MNLKKLIFSCVTLISTIVFGQEFTKEELIGKGNSKLLQANLYLQEEAYISFLKMQEGALREGINIKIISGYRNFDKQKSIWERKYKLFTSQGLSPNEAINKIIEYSTIPGTSRHHWGTDIDIIDGSKKHSGDALMPDKFHGNGPFCKLKNWLDKNANKYGYYLVYTDNANRKGFKYEPWHYSYSPISKRMLKEYKNLPVKTILLDEKLSGAQYFTDEFIEAYTNENILDINPDLH